MSNIRTQIGKIVGKSLNDYHQRVKPKVDDLKFKEEYQGRIIDCMVGEVDDNYIETPETDENVVKLEYSKEGVVKIPRIKGKTILIDAEGNETDTPGEGCRLVSVGEDEDNKVIILSKNKNLFDGEFKKGYAIGIDEGYHFGDFYPSENYSSSINYISVEPNVTYRVNKDRIWVIEYDKYFKPIKFNSGWTTFVFDLNTKYIRFYLSNANTLNVQIEKNENITSYVPHQSHKTEILLDNSLNNIQEVCDFIKDNMFYRTTKKILLRDYPDDWNVNTGWTNDDFLVISRTFEDRKPKSYLTSNLFPTMTYSQSLVDGKVGKECVRYESSSQAIYIFIKKERLETKDVIGFTKWLETSDMEVIYELEEPIMEELPNSITLQGFDDTTMYIENSITPTIQYGYNALIPYKEELSNQKEEVETNTLDIEQNIIPYLMDMEFNLMLMEDN